LLLLHRTPVARDLTEQFERQAPFVCMAAPPARWRQSSCASMMVGAGSAQRPMTATPLTTRSMLGGSPMRVTETAPPRLHMILESLVGGPGSARRPGRGRLLLTRICAAQGGRSARGTTSILPCVLALARDGHGGPGAALSAGFGGRTLRPPTDVALRWPSLLLVRVPHSLPRTRKHAHTDGRGIAQGARTDSQERAGAAGDGMWRPAGPGADIGRPSRGHMTRRRRFRTCWPTCTFTRPCWRAPSWWWCMPAT
jgi:hypothetical protein